jgi:hypothetical protein
MEHGPEGVRRCMGKAYRIEARAERRSDGPLTEEERDEECINESPECIYESMESEWSGG